VAGWRQAAPAGFGSVATEISPPADGESLAVGQFAAIAAAAIRLGYGGKLRPSSRRHEEVDS
jgi:16S rRNA (adenine1518-N6/adenine1519-N6)-dimethyltransferase